MSRRSWLVAVALVGCQNGGDDPVETDPGQTCALERPYLDQQAGDLTVGFARRRIPAPVGIGTAGFGPFGAPSSPSPFADIYPGTKNIHGHPEIKVMIVSRGPGHEAIFVRLDAVGVFSQLRTDIVNRASELLGHNIDAALLIGATHTHSGPGRVVNTGKEGSSFFDIIADKFDPGFYDRFVGDVVGAIVEAYEDRAAGRVGFATADCPDGHNDRRCEDGLVYQNGTAPLVAIERDGALRALLLSYAVHGTIFGLDDLFLSQDVSGAIEEAIEDRFDKPVDAIMFNAWGADMSPGSPEGVPLDVTAAVPPNGGFRQQREVGWAVANAVEDQLDAIVWETEPTIELETHRVAIDREQIGYAQDEFLYPYGGVYCGSNTGTCDPATEYGPELDDGCVPFTEDFPAPNQTDVTVGRIGPFGVLTWPGESGTLLAEKVMSDITAAHPDVTDFLYLGYTQDYLGYSILEDDWFHGGYEASGALWGPKQGEYLSGKVVEAFDSFMTRSCPDDEPTVLQPFPLPTFTAYEAETAIDSGEVVVQPAATVGPSDVVTFTVNGEDPWVGAPLARLVTADGDPVLRPGGIPVDSDDMNFDVTLVETPTYGDEARADRTFAWTFRMPVRAPVEGGVALADGSYKVVVSLPQPEGEPVEVTTDTFSVVTP